MIRNFLRSSLRFLTAFLALLMSIYAIIFNVLQVMGNTNPSYAPDRMTAFIYAILIPLVAVVLAWYFSFKKPFSSTVLALLLLVSPLYLYISFQYTENYQNADIYNNFSSLSNNKLGSTEAQLASLQSEVAELTRKVELQSSVINTLDFDYVVSSLDSYLGLTDITVHDTTVALPTLHFSPKESHGGNDYLRVIDFAAVGDITENAPQLFLPMGLAEYPSDLRAVTIDGKTYSFSSYQFGEGFPIDDNCFSGGGISNDVITVTDRNLAFVVTRTHTEKGCEGKPTEEIHTPSPEEVEEVLKLIESVKF